jgi:metallo-beta-lactamase family protein
MGEEIRVNAKIHTVGGLSAHADQAGLVDWYREFRHSPPVCLVHGEPDAQSKLAGALKGATQARVTIPKYQDTLDLKALGR